MICRKSGGGVGVGSGVGVVALVEHPVKERATTSAKRLIIQTPPTTCSATKVRSGRSRPGRPAAILTCSSTLNDRRELCVVSTRNGPKFAQSEHKYYSSGRNGPMRRRIAARRTQRVVEGTQAQGCADCRMLRAALIALADRVDVVTGRASSLRPSARRPMRSLASGRAQT